MDLVHDIDFANIQIIPTRPTAHPDLQDEFVMLLYHQDLDYIMFYMIIITTSISKVIII